MDLRFCGDDGKFFFTFFQQPPNIYLFETDNKAPIQKNICMPKASLSLYIINCKLMISKYFEDYKKNPIYAYMLGLMISSTVGLQVSQNLFNNFAIDSVGLNAFQVGVTQSVRELAGLLTFMIVFVLMYMKEKTLAGISVVIVGVGLSLTGFFPSFEGLLLTTFISSIGFHFFESTNQSLILQCFTREQTPVVLGKFRSYAAITNMLIGLTVLGFAGLYSFKYLYLQYGLLVVIAGLGFLIFKKVDYEPHPQLRKIMLKRKYWLYYVLNFLVGARRQIFVVFAPMLLVSKFHFSVTWMVSIFVINNVVTFLLGPLIGKSINRIGERKMMSIEYAFLAIVFACYALNDNAYVAAGLFIIDQMFFSFSIAINTYFQKTADKGDIAPSIATGFAINHIMAVIVPVMGGFLWLLNWQAPFFIGSALGLVALYFAQKVRVSS